MKYVYRDYPLESIHKDAFKAAEAASCAGEQGKFWEMHEKLFANQSALKPEDLSSYAKALALDTAKFQLCLDGGKYASEVRQDMTEAQRAGVTGTPTIFIGVTDPKTSKMKVLQRMVGARPFTAFKDAIDSLLAQQK